MKLFKDNCETKEFADKQVLLTAIPSPFKEFIKREDYTNQSFSIGEEEPVSFSKTFVLQVNIKDSSSLYFVYLLENFNKDEIINKIAELKYMRVVDVNSAKEKTKALLKIAKEYNPLFYLYQAKNGIPLFKNELVDVVNELEFSETQFFYADKDIPFLARIVSVADAFDAMTTKRSYRPELKLDYVKNEIKSKMGTQFDPIVATTFLDILNSEYNLISEIQKSY